MQGVRSPKLVVVVESKLVVVVESGECGGGNLLTSLHLENNLPVWALARALLVFSFYCV